MAPWTPPSSAFCGQGRSLRAQRHARQSSRRGGLCRRRGRSRGRRDYKSQNAAGSSYLWSCKGSEREGGEGEGRRRREGKTCSRAGRGGSPTTGCGGWEWRSRRRRRLEPAAGRWDVWDAGACQDGAAAAGRHDGERRHLPRSGPPGPPLPISRFQAHGPQADGAGHGGRQGGRAVEAAGVALDRDPRAASLATQDDLVIRRRVKKGWNESDLDVAYEKKLSQPASYERADVQGGLRQNSAGLPLAPWRESSLDGSIGQSKDERFGMQSATLPRNYKVSSLASERRPESSFRRSLPSNPAGTLPRNWQPISRIPMPPTNPQGSLPKRHKPLPLSMIFRLQNAFWEYGAAGSKFPLSQGSPGSPLLRSLQKQMLQHPLAQSHPHARMSSPGPEGNGAAKAASVPPAEPVRVVPIVLMSGENEAELENLLPSSESAEADEVARPLSPTRLQPVLPPEAQKVPEFEEVARVLAEMPRALKRRGSMEQNPSPAVPPTHKKQYQQIISRLFHPRKEEAPPVGEAQAQTDLSPINEGTEQRASSGAAPAPAPAAAPGPPPPPPSPPHPAASEAPATSSPLPSPEKRSVLRKFSSPRKRALKRARLNPLVLLLDAALTGELDVVKEAVKELNDPSQPNDEGITALHNAICGANYNIVDFLISLGANVNSPDSHGWTPLHCAASCNDTAICVALVKHGAAIFATTFSDGSMAIEKCDPYREGYSECFSYLADVEQNMGLMNNGVVYALWDYSAEFSDELSFREGEPVTVLRRDGQEETDWWWASLYGQEGYVPRNYFGLFPRVRPQQRRA
uniref:Protein phosphatase 1 regulatory subunit 13 like n=1 Tax=Salvator merianae TaxID=96440 RepID=A0A8D0DW68_SALMN